jgi:predicted CXXCH cytochrome family protein
MKTKQRTKFKTKEVTYMRKTLITVFMVLLSVVLTYGLANALVSGVCSNCHTMHDSQDGSGDEGATGTQGYLLTAGCYACHTSGGAANAPKIDGSADNTGTGSGSLADAGGDVDAGTTDQDTRHDVIPGDTNVMAPPGYTTGLTWGTNNVSCDGTYGCHGKHGTTPGVKGLHHVSSGAAYRFLYVQAGNTGADGTAVNGLESTTWEAGGALTSDHNVYDADGGDSISSFCANCHGGFHAPGNTGSASPFTRHPTDEEAVIANVDGSGFTPTSAEIDETPFGFTSAQISAGMLTTDNSTGTAYTSANGKAICLSCHRAHGSAEKDLLRFDYSTMNAGNATNNGGCETCHVAQQ